MGVVLVTRKTPYCQQCDIGKRYLQRAEIPFETVDISTYAGDLGGVKSLPILVIDGNPIGSLEEIRNYARNNL